MLDLRSSCTIVVPRISYTAAFIVLHNRRSVFFQFVLTCTHSQYRYFSYFTQALICFLPVRFNCEHLQYCSYVVLLNRRSTFFQFVSTVRICSTATFVVLHNRGSAFFQFVLTVRICNTVLKSFYSIVDPSTFSSFKLCTPLQYRTYIVLRNRGSAFFQFV